MKQTHCIPEIYNPALPLSVKCAIVSQLCQALAVHRGVSSTQLRKDLLEKLHIDCENLEANPVGMLLLYEYLHSQRPAACSASVVERVH
jgi:hypothetical protein